MPVRIEIDRDSAEQLRRIARELRTIGDGKTIPRELRKSLRSSVQPDLVQTRSAARSLPSNGQRTVNSLRSRIARNIQIQVKTSGDPSVGLRISKRGMEDKGNLPKLMDAGAWRHPVPPDGRVWVAQISRPGWFTNVQRSQAPYVERQLDRTIEAFGRRLSG
jgi:uncharacterized protein (UPF0147 family)